MTIPNDFHRDLARGAERRRSPSRRTPPTPPRPPTPSPPCRRSCAARSPIPPIGPLAKTAVAAGGGPEVVVHRLYNPEGVNAYNIVPGLIGTILTMTTTLMTALALTREIERGTMENLLAMPVRPARS